MPNIILRYLQTYLSSFSDLHRPEPIHPNVSRSSGPPKNETKKTLGRHPTTNPNNDRWHIQGILIHERRTIHYCLQINTPPRRTNCEWTSDTELLPPGVPSERNRTSNELLYINVEGNGSSKLSRTGRNYYYHESEHQGFENKNFSFHAFSMTVTCDNMPPDRPASRITGSTSLKREIKYCHWEESIWFTHQRSNRICFLPIEVSENSVQRWCDPQISKQRRLRWFQSHIRDSRKKITRRVKYEAQH